MGKQRNNLQHNRDKQGHSDPVLHGHILSMLPWSRLSWLPKLRLTRCGDKIECMMLTKRRSKASALVGFALVGLALAGTAIGAMAIGALAIGALGINSLGWAPAGSRS